MPFDFTFRTLDSERNLRRLIDFMSRQDLGYVGYPDWLQRTEHELDIGFKQAIVAFGENGEIIGDLVCQPEF